MTNPLIARLEEAEGGTVRDAQTGRFAGVRCDDLNCCGSLKADFAYGSPIWSCDGLTFDLISGPLLACNRTFPRATLKAIAAAERE